MDETKAEKIARLQREIGERQAELAVLICGDPHKTVIWPSSMEIVQTLPTVTLPGSRGPYEGSDGWPQ